MREQAKVTSKSQITLPREIRRLLGIHPGDKVLFESSRGGVRVRPLRAQSPFERYREIGNPGLGSGKDAVVRWVRELRGE